jgi:hypothetical protein
MELTTYSPDRDFLEEPNGSPAALWVAKALSAHEAANFKKLAAEPFQSHFQILDGRASNSFNASLLHQVSASIPPL